LFFHDCCIPSRTSRSGATIFGLLSGNSLCCQNAAASKLTGGPKKFFLEFENRLHQFPRLGRLGSQDSGGQPS
jgi:hypothetical protein